MDIKNIKNLKAIVTGEVEETFDLIKDGEHVGFNHLQELVGNDYDDLNDDLMENDFTMYTKYNDAEAVFYIDFKVGFEDFQAEALDGNGVENDADQVWVNVGGKQYTIDISWVLDHEEVHPFDASCYLEDHLDAEAWDDLYEMYLED